MKNTGLVAVRGDSVVRILRVEFSMRALCQRDDGERKFWAKIHRGKHSDDYIMSKGIRHIFAKRRR